MDYSGFYVQDQWTLKRFTLSGAIRYDHATSNYLGNVHWRHADRAVCARAGWRNVCRAAQLLHAATDGVSYNDVTPRWGVAWDMFGTGKTSVKWNMGKYLSGAGITGIYADANPAQRTVNEYTRTWTDVNGNRRVDCDLLNFNAQNMRQAGTSAAGQPRSSGTGQRCGMDATRSAWTALVRRSVWRRPSADAREAGIPADVQAYCDVYGDSLLDGWGKRRSEWQFGLGIQHEILPRFSAEVTYNRRSYSNLTVTDQLGDRLRSIQRRAGHADVPGRLPELHVSARLRLLQCRGAKQSWPAGRRRIRDSRARQPECDVPGRAGRPR